MTWSKRIMQALKFWLGPDTAGTGQLIDDVNFYLFIAEIWKEHKQLWDEAEAKEIITGQAKTSHPHWTAEQVEDIVNKRTAEGTLILDFLSALESRRQLWLLLYP